MKKKNPHVGSSLDDFLREEGILEQTRATALKEVIAWQVQQAMRKNKDQQSGDGATHEYQPCGSGPPARSRQCFGDPADAMPSRAGHWTRSAC